MAGTGKTSKSLFSGLALIYSPNNITLWLCCSTCELHLVVQGGGQRLL